MRESIVINTFKTVVCVSNLLLRFHFVFDYPFCTSINFNYHLQGQLH